MRVELGALCAALGVAFEFSVMAKTLARRKGVSAGLSVEGWLKGRPFREDAENRAPLSISCSVNCCRKDVTGTEGRRP
jgi:hypothetical protein